MHRSRPIQSVAARRRLPLVATGLIAAAVLAVLPGRLADAVRAPIAAGLAPAQRGLAVVRKAGSDGLVRVRAQLAGAEAAAQREAENQHLAEENRQLKAELQAARDQVRLLAGSEPANPPLLTAECISARVLGAAAQSYLARNQLLDAGRLQGVEPGDTVLRPATPLVDRGMNVGVDNGNLVLAGSCVWGKVTWVGSHTSTVCPMTEPGYRDLVRLATPAGQGRSLRLGAKGMLEGTGEALARLRMIETTEPVAEGDLVVSMAGQGFVDMPLMCGKVVRVESPHGAGHWEIWVAPAAGELPGTVSILRPAAEAQELVRRQDRSAASTNSE